MKSIKDMFDENIEESTRGMVRDAAKTHGEVAERMDEHRKMLDSTKPMSQEERLEPVIREMKADRKSRRIDMLISALVALVVSVIANILAYFIILRLLELN